MSEEETNSVAQDEQVSAETTQNEQVQNERQEAAEESRKRNDQDRNWAEARRKMQELERQNQELAEKISRVSKPEAPIEEDYGIKDDEIAEGKHVKELKRELREIKSYIKQREVSTVEERIKTKFPDYDEVVTKDNIEYLKQKSPYLVEALANNKDPYAQAVAVYDALKMATPPKQNYPDKERAAKNAAKPVSVNAVTKQSPLGNAQMFENGLTPELKAQLLKEMNDAARFAR